MAALETVHADTTFRIFRSRNIQLNVWKDAPRSEHMREFRRIGAVHNRRHPQGSGLINMILSGTPSFSSEVRDETVKLMKETSMFRLGTAHVVLVGGLSGTSVRAFLSTVMLLGRPPLPNKVFGDMNSAAGWLAPRLAESAEVWSPAALVALMQEVKASV